MEGVQDVCIISDGINGDQRGPLNQETALALRTRNFHGADANPARHGGDASPISVTLQTISSGKGFIAVDRRTRNPQIHVGLNRNLHLSAVGGNGEHGGVGGDGRDGTTGYSGQDATRTRDATGGGDGGPGGNGGHGSHGGDGGRGGDINIAMSNYDMHLAYVVTHNNVGGKGGKAGRHGQPGRGGRGGKGGSGHTWQEQTGSHWVCASDCGSGSSNAVVRSSGSQLNPSGGLLLAIADGALSDGTNMWVTWHDIRVSAALLIDKTRHYLNNVVATIPASYSAIIHDALRSSAGYEGALTTRSSSGHTAACYSQPDYTTRSRPKGADGRRGHDGRAPSSALHTGKAGAAGSTSFQVFDPAGREAPRSYSANFDFQLQHFDVSDENEDGIFEPGECVVISNILVSNPAPAGAMPTPRFTRIPITQRPVDQLTLVSGMSSVAMPLDIQPGDAKSVPAIRSIRSEIAHPEPEATKGRDFGLELSIGLQATIPDISRQVEKFDITHNIVVQYPLKMPAEGFRYLDSVPHGSKMDVSWLVQNASRKPLGAATSSRRSVSTEFRCDSPAAMIRSEDILLRTSSGSLMKSVQRIPELPAQDAQKIVQKMYVVDEAEEHSTLNFEVRLGAAPVRAGAQPASSNGSTEIQMKNHAFSVRVSNRWKYNKHSTYLLLTCATTPKNRITAWKDYIEKGLHRSVDVYDISQYGGMTADRKRHIFDLYRGKTIIALDGSFNFQRQGQRYLLDFQPPDELYDAAIGQTGFVSIISRPGLSVKNAVLSKMIITAGSAMENGSRWHQTSAVDACTVRNEELSFDSPKLFLDSLKAKSTESTRVTLSRTRWTVDNCRSGKRLARSLRKRCPRDRFLVLEQPEVDRTVVVLGLPQGQNIRVTTTPVCDNITLEENDYVNSVDAFLCAAALPFQIRLDILREVDLSAPASKVYSDATITAVKHSVLFELHQEVACLSGRGIWTDSFFNYRHEKFTTTSIVPGAHNKIATLLAHDLVTTKGDELAPIAREVLVSLVLSARCQTVRQLLRKILWPLHRTRSHVKRGLLDQVKQLFVASAPCSTNEPGKWRSAGFQAFCDSTRQGPIPQRNGRKICNEVRRLTHDGLNLHIERKMAITRQRYNFDTLKDGFSDNTTTMDMVMPKTLCLSQPQIHTWKKLRDKVVKRQRKDAEHVRRLQRELNLDVGENTDEVLEDFPTTPQAPAAPVFIDSFPNTGIEETASIHFNLLSNNVEMDQIASMSGPTNTSPPADIYELGSRSSTDGCVIESNDAGSRDEAVRRSRTPNAQLVTPTTIDSHTSSSPSSSPSLLLWEDTGPIPGEDVVRNPVFAVHHGWSEVRLQAFMLAVLSWMRTREGLDLMVEDVD